MATPTIVSHLGALTGSPAPGPVGCNSFGDVVTTNFTGTYTMAKMARPTIIGATDGAPFVVAFETIVRCRVFVMRVLSGTIRVKITTAFGTDQVVPCSSTLVLHVPFAGDEITAIKLVGTADVEYYLAGDVS